VTRAVAVAGALGLIAAIVLAANAGGGGAVENDLLLNASAPETGQITLQLKARPGVEVVLRDDLTGRERRVTPRAASTVVKRFATWSCASRRRTFSASQAAADGSVATATAELRTPGCGRRLALVARRAVRAPARVAVRIRDRWRIGDIAARLCVLPPGSGQRCRSVRVQRGGDQAEVTVRALRPGRYRLTATTRYQRLRDSVRARPASGRLSVLATGDSMIQIIDSYLAARLRGAVVRSEAHISTGISKPSMLNWQAEARRQARRRHPDVVIMFIGANDGFPMGKAGCCGAAWVAEYARRARNMMRSYARGGRARVYWLLLPLPREGFFREIFPAVNAALRRAARGRSDDVRLVELDEFFTPGGRYRSSMEVNGRVVTVRQSDGVHLNTTGASLAADLVIGALRDDRMVR
jgi:lysophospholipase L1-like esterase